MRLRNNPKALEKILKSKIIIRKWPVSLDPNTILELGSGKGRMIRNMAKSFSDKNFIGVEKNITIVWKSISNIEKENLQNVKILLGDLELVSEFFNGKCSEIWITFPDPWPQKKYQNRRLTHINFLKAYEKILIKKGKLKIKTDDLNLYHFTLSQLKLGNWTIIKKLKDIKEDKEILSKNIRTDYEVKWTNLKKTIKYIEAKKS